MLGRRQKKACANQPWNYFRSIPQYLNVTDRKTTDDWTNCRNNIAR